MDARQIHHRPGRTRTPLAIHVVLLAPIISGCAEVNSRAPVAFQEEAWTYRNASGAKLITPHYDIYTTLASKPLVETLPSFQEGCWEAYCELLPATLPPDQRLETYVFQHRRHWERFTEEFAGPRAATYKLIRSGGYSERGITVSHYGSRRSTLSILAHEGLHQYLDVTHGKPIPAWINEGLACYFESFDLGPDGRPTFEPKKNTVRTPALREAFSRERLQPLEALLATDAGHEIGKQSRDVLAYYAQAWSIIVFLLDEDAGHMYTPKFRVLLADLGSDAMERKARAYMAADTDGRMSYGEAVFRAYVTEDLDAFKTLYQAYIPRLLKLAS